MDNPFALLFREFFGRGKNIISFEELYNIGIKLQNIDEANSYLKPFGLKIEKFSSENKLYFYVNAFDNVYQEDTSLTPPEAMLLDYIIIETADKREIPESQIHHFFEGDSHIGGKTIPLLKKLERYSLIIRNEGNIVIAPLTEKLINIPRLRQKLLQERQKKLVIQKHLDDSHD
ncbi:MAG: hypothetical protein ACFFDI_20460 [Promethearchaeota archaeon]